MKHIGDKGRRQFVKAALAGAGAALLPTVSSRAYASKRPLVLGGLQGANSIAFSMVGEFLPTYTVQYRQFNTVADITTAMLKGEIDAAQIIYTALVSLASSNVPAVAISGQVNGGSDIVIGNHVDLAPNDWTRFKQLVAKDKKRGSKFRIGSFFGSVQDIELRLQLLKYGIDPLHDVDILNIPYPGMDQALFRGTVSAVVPVQPFGVSIILEKHGKHFAYPYDQAAGNLTNVIMVSKATLNSHYSIAVDLAKGMAKLTDYLKTPSGIADWRKVALKYSNVSNEAINLTLKQLIPDYRMPFNKLLAMANAMYHSGFISTNLTAEMLKQHVDYAPLHAATGLSVKELGS